jgi:hypothetical protein
MWWAIGVSVALFLFFGLAYWANNPGLSAPECLFGSSGCSTSAATWALAIFALISFGAASEAIAWTISLFQLETKSILGQSECSKRGKGHLTDLEIFVLDDQLLQGRRPVGYNPSTLRNDYYIHHVGFANLGRTALVNISVRMHLDDQKPCEIALGNIRRDDETHVVIYVSRSYQKKDPKVCWSEACQDGVPVEFCPSSPMTSEAVYGISGDQPSLPGM